MKRLTILTILLAALCLAPPAWADTLPILTGVYNNLFAFLDQSVDVTTSQFTVFTNSDGPTFGTYQGVSYCATQAGFAFDCNSGALIGFPASIGADFIFGFTPPPGCPVPEFCADMTMPAHLTVFVNFTVNGQQIFFTAMGDGVALSRQGVGVYHADFGSAIPTPEPSTWLLFGSGLVGLGFSRLKRKI